jgi:hypothetical protein
MIVVPRNNGGFEKERLIGKLEKQLRDLLAKP